MGALPGIVLRRRSRRQEPHGSVPTVRYRIVIRSALPIISHSWRARRPLVARSSVACGVVDGVSTHRWPHRPLRLPFGYAALELACGSVDRVDGVEGPLRAGPITVPTDELAWRFSRSSGPGGQGVNTTDSRV